MMNLRTRALGAMLTALVAGAITTGCCRTPAQLVDGQPTPRQEATGRYVAADGGRVWNIFGYQIVGKLGALETAGEYAVVVSTQPPGKGSPLHLHSREDELFYVVRGTYEFRCGADVYTAGPGDIVALPRGIPHAFRNVGDVEGKLMNTITPAGFEEFFVEIDQLPKDGPPPRDVVTAIAERYGLTLLPPPAAASKAE